MFDGSDFIRHLAHIEMLRYMPQNNEYDTIVLYKSSASSSVYRSHVISRFLRYRTWQPPCPHIHWTRCTINCDVACKENPAHIFLSGLYWKRPYQAPSSWCKCRPWSGFIYWSFAIISAVSHHCAGSGVPLFCYGIVYFTGICFSRQS